MLQMLHNNYDFLTYLKEVHTDLYREDVAIPFSFKPDSDPAHLALDLAPQEVTFYLPEVYTVPSPPTYRPISIYFPQATFPPSLLAQIFRFLDPRDDAGTLFSCLSTCKSWYYPALMRLYHSINVHNERSLFLLWDKLSSIPQLARAVREVRLNDASRFLKPRNPRKGVAGHWESSPLWLLRTPARIAPFVPYAKQLSFEHINWEMLRLRDDLLSQQWLSQWMSFPPLQELNLSSCAFSSFHEFEMVMMSLPKLYHLRLDTVSWGDHAAATADALRADQRRLGIALDALSIGYRCDVQSLVMWILATSTIGTIKKLDMLAGHESAPEIVVPFINRFRDTLEYLTIGCEGYKRTLACEHHPLLVLIRVVTLTPHRYSCSHLAHQFPRMAQSQDPTSHATRYDHRQSRLDDFRPRTSPPRPTTTLPIHRLPNTTMHPIRLMPHLSLAPHIHPYSSLRAQPLQ